MKMVFRENQHTISFLITSQNLFLSVYWWWISRLIHVHILINYLLWIRCMLFKNQHISNGWLSHVNCRLLTCYRTKQSLREPKHLFQRRITWRGAIVNMTVDCQGIPVWVAVPCVYMLCSYCIQAHTEQKPLWLNKFCSGRAFFVPVPTHLCVVLQGEQCEAIMVPQKGVESRVKSRGPLVHIIRQITAIGLHCDWSTLPDIARIHYLLP